MTFLNEPSSIFAASELYGRFKRTRRSIGQLDFKHRDLSLLLYFTRSILVLGTTSRQWKSELLQVCFLQKTFAQKAKSILYLFRRSIYNRLNSIISSPSIHYTDLPLDAPIQSIKSKPHNPSAQSSSSSQAAQTHLLKRLAESRSSLSRSIRKNTSRAKGAAEKVALGHAANSLSINNGGRRGSDKAGKGDNGKGELHFCGVFFRRRTKY